MEKRLTPLQVAKLTEPGRQWRKSIDCYLAPIADMPVGEIDTAAVLAVLKPLWQTVPATASRLRGRIEAVLNSAKALNLRSGENPAAWRGHLALILPGRGRVEKPHLAELDYAADFIRSLRAKGTTAALALEFVILTAARTGEVRGARWNNSISRRKSGRSRDRGWPGVNTGCR